MALLEAETVAGKQKSGKMRFVLVFRECGSDGVWRSKIWTGANRRHAADSLQRHLWRTQFRTTLHWTTATERYVLENYHKYSTAEIAQQLRNRWRQRFTKNAVISKYHSLKGTRTNGDANGASTRTAGRADRGRDIDDDC